MKVLHQQCHHCGRETNCLIVYGEVRMYRLTFVNRDDDDDEDDDDVDDEVW